MSDTGVLVPGSGVLVLVTGVLVPVTGVQAPKLKGDRMGNVPVASDTSSFIRTCTPLKQAI